MVSWDALAANIGGNHWTDPPRIPFLTCSGTWAAPGTGYCSWVVQAADQSRVIEVPVQAPWSFGPIGGAPGAPSYEESIVIGLDWAVDWLNANTGPFGLSGYSQGGECASRIYMELQDGRLTHRMADFIGGFTFGNPSRELDHTYPGGKNPNKGTAGISHTQLVGTPATWNDYAQKGDMYTCTPYPDPAGEIMRDCYDMCVQIGIGDPIGFVQNLIAIIQNLQFLGGDATIVDAIQAATIAITFLAQGTGPHITYETGEAEPGVTYLEHARRHVNSLVGA